MFESCAYEIDYTKNEIINTLNNLDDWTKPQKVNKTPKKSSGSGANFIELLSREFCLANIFAKHFKTDYQPKYINNFTCKFGWYPRKSAKQIFLVSNFLCLAAL